MMWMIPMGFFVGAVILIIVLGFQDKARYYRELKRKQEAGITPLVTLTSAGEERSS